MVNEVQIQTAMIQEEAAEGCDTESWLNKFFIDVSFVGIGQYLVQLFENLVSESAKKKIKILRK